jgi:hypothetical protein
MSKTSREKRYELDYERRAETLARQLKQARRDAGITQTLAAYMLGTNQTFISRAERKGDVVDFLTLERMCAMYDKPLQFFATMSDPSLGKRKPSQKHSYENHTIEEWEHHLHHREWSDLRSPTMRVPSSDRRSTYSG